MAEGQTPVEIFCSYAHEDEMWLRQVETHLSLLKRQGLISLWHDRLIAPGTDWASTIDVHLETASVILLLVSADFFASDYCYGIEMKRALERQEAGKARVVPILVRQVDWTNALFAHLQALPTDAKPIASWRDKDRVLADVAAGIRRAIEDVPLLATSAPRAALPAIWNIPYPRNPFFLGREAELLQIRHNLYTDQSTTLAQPQAISGLGGIGKTQLALEYAYRYHQDYKAVLWARAENADELMSSYMTLAILLRLPEREAKEQEVTVQAVKTWLQTHRDWLLILDNADDLTLLPKFLPPAFSGHLLLTTRATATGRLARRLGIETLPPEQGTLFLLRRAGLIPPDVEVSQASAEQQELAKQISEVLGGLPLALEQAGAYLEETGTSLANYWQVYQQDRTELLRKRGELVLDYPSSVATTWSLSFQRVEERNPTATNLLKLSSFLAPDVIPEEIFTEGSIALDVSLVSEFQSAIVKGENMVPLLDRIKAGKTALNQSFSVLQAYSLIRRNPNERTLSIHRLVQVVLQDGLTKEERRVWAEEAMLAVYLAFPKEEFGVWLQWERLLPHALAVAQGIRQYQITTDEAVNMLYKTAGYLQDRARYAEAESLYQQVLYICEQNEGPEHFTVAYPLNNLASIYHEQGKLAEAESLYQRTLRIWEQQMGPEQPRVARILNNLAELYRKQGKYTEAEPLYQRALHIREQNDGPKDPTVAHSFYYLANLYSDQGKYTEAELLYQRALHILEPMGPEDPDVAHALNGLAELYRKQGKYTEAEPLYQRALHIREKQLGPEHLLTIETMSCFAQLREIQGNNEEARIWYIRVLAVRSKTLGVYHPKTTEIRKRLIILLHAMGQHENAARLENEDIQPEP